MPKFPSSIDSSVWSPEVEKVTQLESGTVLVKLSTGPHSSVSLWFDDLQAMSEFAWTVLESGGCGQRPPVVVTFHTDANDEVLSNLGS